MRALIYVIAVICLISAVAVVGVRHENRISFIELQALYQERDNLNIEWRRLLLEQAALSRYKQLEDWASSNLTMESPEQQIVLLVPENEMRSRRNESANGKKLLSDSASRPDCACCRSDWVRDVAGARRTVADYFSRVLAGTRRCRFLRNETITANRGIIRDRNGKILAISTPVDSGMGRTGSPRQCYGPGAGTCFGT